MPATIWSRPAERPWRRRPISPSSKRSATSSKPRPMRSLRRRRLRAANFENFKLGITPKAGEGLRLPPQSVEAEQAVLGGLMLDSAAWDQVADRVLAEDFYRKDHRLIFAAVAGLIERNQPCDAVTLSGHLD